MSEIDYKKGLSIVRDNYRMYAGLKKRQYGYYISRTSPAEGQEEAFKTVQTFTHKFINGGKPVRLLLVGGVGSGKTFMVSSVVNRVIDSIEISEREVEQAVEKAVAKGYGFGVPVLKSLYSLSALLN